ncbi:hypothetical protein EJ07DRAFT_113473, partial [Lizonia empirigonia]
TNCWNEAAAKAGCDPNKSDACLCGPFFNAVTYCTAETCSAGDNLGTLLVSSLNVIKMLMSTNLAALNFLSSAC